jgi:plasmid stabilization system protein ParE
MNRALVVTPEAEADIAQAKEWYLSQSSRAAERFRDAVDLALETIERNPEQYQIVYRQTRRVLLDEYPHALFYTARDPKLWR